MNTMSPQDGALRVLALGDSLTYGYLVRVGYLEHVEAGLTAALPEALVRLMRHGVCGDTVFDGLRRLPPLLARLRPNVVLVQFGLNDLFQGITAERFAGGLDAVLEQCAEAGVAGAVLVPPPPPRAPLWEEDVQPFRAVFADCGVRWQIPVAPVAELWRGAPPDDVLWLDDGVHPSEAGYRHMAAAVLQVLRGEGPEREKRVRSETGSGPFG